MSTDYELTFVGDLIYPNLTPSEMRECAKVEGMRREYFHDSDCLAAFDALMDSEADDDMSALAKIVGTLKGKREKQKLCHDHASINETFARNNVQDFVEDAHKKAFACGAGKLLARFNSGEIGQAECAVQIAKLAEENVSRSSDGDNGVTPDELGPIKPEEERPDALFKNGWLRKGGCAMLVAETGKGKSVLSLQMAYCWACGKAAFGIEPIRKLKIAVFQTEDDEDEMRLFRDNIKKGLKKFHKWSDDDLKTANGNIKLFGTAGLVGEKFIEHLRSKLFGKGFDLVILNPLQGVYGGDLIQNSELSLFLRDKLDGVIKAESTKCGVLIVHHTNKPPLNPQQKRIDAYMGAGGAELPNWIRAMLILDEQKDGSFMLVAPKRGQRLGWTQKKANLPAIKILQSFKEHNLIFWREDDSAAGAAGAAAVPEETLEDKAKRLADALTEKAQAGEPCGKTEARKLAQQVVGNIREGNKVYDLVIKNPNKYGLEAKKTGNSTEVVIVLKGS